MAKTNKPKKTAKKAVHVPKTEVKKTTDKVPVVLAKMDVALPEKDAAHEIPVTKATIGPIEAKAPASQNASSLPAVTSAPAASAPTGTISSIESSSQPSVGTPKPEEPKKRSLFHFSKKDQAPKVAATTPKPAASATDAKSAMAPAGHGAKKKDNSLKAFLISINYIGMGKQRTMFIQSLATMLNAGLPLIDALGTLALEIRAKAMKKVVQKIKEAVEAGSPLWRAMEDQYFFTLYEIALVRIGEEAGNLARNVEYLSIQQEKDHALRAKVKMAMIYPTIVLTLMFIIVMGLGMFVLPNLIQVLFSLNVELPLSTRIVITITKAFNEHGAVFAPLTIILFVMFILLGKYTRFRVVTQWLVFQIPGIGRLAREATIARFGVILGGLLQAGVPLVEAMHSLVEVTPIVSYKQFYKKVLEHIMVGDSFSKTFEALPKSTKILPISVQQLIVTGEKSGALSDILIKIADIYEKKAAETAEKLPTILEPMLLLFIGALVGGIAFSIIVPIYSVVGNVGR